MTQKYKRLTSLFRSYGRRHLIKVLKILFVPIDKFKYDTIFGFPLYLNLYKDVDARFYLNEFEQGTLSLFHALLKNDSVVLDVGANIGIYSVLAASKNNNVKVFAFEPADEAYNSLIGNLRLNNLKNVKAEKFGVADYKREAILSRCDDDAYNSLGKPMREVKDEVSVSLISLDDYCREHKLNKVDLIKIDTEGADYLVLKGAYNILSGADSPIIFCEYNRYINSGFNYTVSDMISYIEDAGYQIFEFNNNRLIRFNPLESKSDELICLKSEHYSRMPVPVIK